MKNILIFFSTAIPVLLILPPVFAADSNDLQRVVGIQQKQIDMQQQQLEVQRTMLLDMQKKLEGLTGSASPQVAIAKEKTTAGTAIKTIARRTDTNSSKRDKEHPDDEWKGSFEVKGVNTRMKIGGFAELDVIHDTDAIASKGQFVTSTITIPAG